MSTNGRASQRVNEMTECVETVSPSYFCTLWGFEPHWIVIGKKDGIDQIVNMLAISGPQIANILTS